jgi:hypothetical protein
VAAVRTEVEAEQSGLDVLGHSQKRQPRRKIVERQHGRLIRCACHRPACPRAQTGHGCFGDSALAQIRQAE